MVKAKSSNNRIAEIEKKEEAKEQIVISPPKFEMAVFEIEGLTPYCQAKFSQKAKEQMMNKMSQGSTATKGSKREPRDFDDNYKQAMHISKKGWNGIPASAFRNAMISACRVCGFVMTKAKLCVFVEADGVDDTEGTPLVELKGTPERTEMAARNDDGSCDIRVRPLWPKWSCTVKVRYDAEIFTINDVTNLMNRVGMQVGIGEGRPDSRKSAGLGFGLFRIKGVDMVELNNE